MKTILRNNLDLSQEFVVPRKWTLKEILYAEDIYIWKNVMVEQNLIGTGWGGN